MFTLQHSKLYDAFCRKASIKTNVTLKAPNSHQGTPQVLLLPFLSKKRQIPTHNYNHSPSPKNHLPSYVPNLLQKQLKVVKGWILYPYHLPSEGRALLIRQRLLFYLITSFYAPLKVPYLNICFLPAILRAVPQRELVLA